MQGFVISYFHNTNNGGLYRLGFVRQVVPGVTESSGKQQAGPAQPAIWRITACTRSLTLHFQSPTFAFSLAVFFITAAAGVLVTTHFCVFDETGEFSKSTENKTNVSFYHRDKLFVLMRAITLQLCSCEQPRK